MNRSTFRPIAVCKCAQCRADTLCGLAAMLARNLLRLRRFLRRNFCDICILALVCVTCYLLLVIISALETASAPIVPLF